MDVNPHPANPPVPSPPPWVSVNDTAQNGRNSEVSLTGAGRPPGESFARFAPFPVDALPEPLCGFVAAGAKAIGCDISFVALPLLTMLGAAIGNTRTLRVKRGWEAPAILWTAIVGDSGTAKSPAFKLAVKPLRNRQGLALRRHAEAIQVFLADQARHAKTLADWKREGQNGDPPKPPAEPKAERCVVSDTTVEALAPLLLENPRGLLLARDELAGWIGSFDRYASGKGGADATQWLSMFNGENITVDRKTGVPPTLFVPRASVCVSGGIQPPILHRALGREHRESGLAARLLLAFPPRVAKLWTEADIDPAAERQLAQLVERLFELQLDEDDDGELHPVALGMTREAKASWIAYFNAHNVEQKELTGDLAAAWSKLEEYAARLALVVHLARWAADDPALSDVGFVDATSMEAGIRLATWFKGEAQRVYAVLGETEDDRDRRHVVDWINRKGGSTTVRQVQAGCRWLRESGAAEAALQFLVKSGIGYWDAMAVSPRGGRPTRTFCLHERSPVNETPAALDELEGFADVDTVDIAATQNANDAADEWGSL